MHINEALSIPDVDAAFLVDLETARVHHLFTKVLDLCFKLRELCNHKQTTEYTTQCPRQRFMT